jgi:hypothetical protein
VAEEERPVKRGAVTRPARRLPSTRLTAANNPFATDWPIGLERTADRLLRALLGGTLRYAIGSLEEMFLAEVQAAAKEARLEAAA